MFHVSRRFNAKGCSNVNDLVGRILIERPVLCQGWRLGDYLFLNDSFSRTGAFDLAMLRIKGQDGGMTVCDQLDSIAVDLYSPEELWEHISQGMSPDVIPHGQLKVLVQSPGEHGRCLWCGSEGRQPFEMSN